MLYCRTLHHAPLLIHNHLLPSLPACCLPPLLSSPSSLPSLSLSIPGFKQCGAKKDVCFHILPRNHLYHTHTNITTRQSLTHPTLNTHPSSCTNHRRLTTPLPPSDTSTHLRTTPRPHPSTQVIIIRAQKGILHLFVHCAFTCVCERVL